MTSDGDAHERVRLTQYPSRPADSPAVGDPLFAACRLARGCRTIVIDDRAFANARRAFVSSRRAVLPTERAFIIDRRTILPARWSFDLTKRAFVP